MSGTGLLPGEKGSKGRNQLGCMRGEGGRALIFARESFVLCFNHRHGK